MKPKTITETVTSEIRTLFVGTIILLLHLIFTAIISPIYIYRFILCKWSHILNPSLGEMITARGQYLAGDDFTSTRSPRANFVITLILEGHQTLPRVKEIVTENVRYQKLPNGKLKYPELTQYVTKWPSYFGFYFWKDEENFNLDEHVFQHQPSPSVTDEDFQKHVEELINEPFEKGKSPWRLLITNNYVDPNLSSEPMTLVTFKVHHCMSDAYGILYLAIQHLGGGVAAHAMPKFKKPSIWKMLTFPFQAVYELVQFSALNVHQHPWKISDEKKSWKQLYRKSKIISVEKIKSIKDKLGVSFPAVVTSAFTAACHKTLKDQGMDDELLETPSLFVLPLPDHPKILRNHATAAGIPLPVDEKDSLKRLESCNRAIENAKSSVIPIIGKYLPLSGGALTTGLSSFVGKNRHIPVGITNFPISSVQYELMERKLLQVSVGVGALSGNAGMACGVYSYVNGIQFATTVESALMSPKEVKQFVQYIEDEIDLLHELALIKAKKRE